MRRKRIPWRGPPRTARPFGWDHLTLAEIRRYEVLAREGAKLGGLTLSERTEMVRLGNRRVAPRG